MSSGERPQALRALPDHLRVDLDVREDLRQRREPFPRIMAAVSALQPDQVLVLRALFEPRPLYQVLGQRGFGHWAERHAADDWSVWFYRESPALLGSAPVATSDSGSTCPAASRQLDVRGLEPPEPMVRVLNRLDQLEAGESLEVIHDRRPLFLYPQLEARGFLHETDESQPGAVRIRIRRPGGPAGCSA